jgi:hypothetical protein
MSVLTQMSPIHSNLVRMGEGQPMPAGSHTVPGVQGKMAWASCLLLPLCAKLVLLSTEERGKCQPRWPTCHKCCIVRTQENRKDIDFHPMSPALG